VSEEKFAKFTRIAFPVQLFPLYKWSVEVLAVHPVPRKGAKPNYVQRVEFYATHQSK
jgi:hypothetical protein